MNWQTTYPTLETVMLAGFKTLATWDDSLPAPQTDVERTIRRRIKAQKQATAAAEMTRTAPELAKKLGDAYRSIERMTGVKMPEWLRKP